MRTNKRPATLRSAVFLGGAILGSQARQPVLYIAQSWGGTDKRKPLMDKVLEWRKRSSPKFESSTARSLKNMLNNAAELRNPGSLLETTIDTSYNQPQRQSLLNKMDELINALRR